MKELQTNGKNDTAVRRIIATRIPRIRYRNVIIRVVASRTQKQGPQKEYRAASAEYHRITRYLKVAAGILTKGERSLLSEFAEVAKRKYERLRKRVVNHAA